MLAPPNIIMKSSVTNKQTRRNSFQRPLSNNNKKRNNAKTVDWNDAAERLAIV